MQLCLQYLEQRDHQRDHAQQRRWIGRFRSHLGLIAEVSLVATVALALKLGLKPRLLRLVELAGHFELPALTDDAVGERVQVQVNVTVWVFAQAAAVRIAQGLAA